MQGMPFGMVSSAQLVQGLLAPLQFLVFAISAVLVLRYLGPKGAPGMPFMAMADVRPCFLIVGQVSGSESSIDVTPSWSSESWQSSTPSPTV